MERDDPAGAPPDEGRRSGVEMTQERGGVPGMTPLVAVARILPGGTPAVATAVVRDHAVLAGELPGEGPPDIGVEAGTMDEEDGVPPPHLCVE